MVLGTQAIEMARRQVSPFPQALVEQSSNDHPGGKANMTVIC
jgi:hypothetical protein